MSFPPIPNMKCIGQRLHGPNDLRLNQRTLLYESIFKVGLIDLNFVFISNYLPIYLKTFLLIFALLKKVKDKRNQLLFSTCVLPPALSSDIC